LTSDSPIADIALDCGLADQSHLTRLFSRSEGLPPGAWRRMLRGSGPRPRPSRRRSNSGAAIGLPRKVASKNAVRLARNIP
jgi:AraC-like DNA-binding protein